VGVLAPLDTQVRITMHAGWRTRSFCGAEGPPSCAEGRFELLLRRAPSAAAGGARPSSAALVPVMLRESSFLDAATVTLLPVAPLAARTRYELVYAEHDAKVAPRVVGTFTTSAAVDTTAPKWSGIASHHVVGQAIRAAGTGVVTLEEECAERGIRFEANESASDDQTPPGQLRYGVWVGDPTGAIDYSAPPIAYLEGRFEQQRPPKPPLFVLLLDAGDEPKRFVFPQGRRTAKLGLRAVDMAGNTSAPSEMLVKLP
jgi:hypothetical protein